MTSNRGSYVLLLCLDEPRELSIGALGEVPLDPGGYAYAGSAWGPGGFSRVERHRALAAGDSTNRHWHIDYLLTDAQVEFCDAIYFPDRDIECQLAEEIGQDVVPGFGSSDCSCETHLSAAPDVTQLERAVQQARQDLRQ